MGSIADCPSTLYPLTPAEKPNSLGGIQCLHPNSQLRPQLALSTPSTPVTGARWPRLSEHGVTLRVTDSGQSHLLSQVGVCATDEEKRSSRWGSMWPQELRAGSWLAARGWGSHQEEGRTQTTTETKPQPRWPLENKPLTPPHTHNSGHHSWVTQQIP